MFLKSLARVALVGAAAVAIPAWAAKPAGAAIPGALRLALARTLAAEHATSPRPLDASTWVEQEVAADDGVADDVFGFSVAIDGSVALVGAAQGSAAGTGGDNGGAGAVYVFELTPQGWTETQKLTADDGLDDDEFGYSIALQGSTAVIGAAFAEIGGNAHQGAAYVFTRSGDTWFQQQKLVADDGAASDSFAWSVALDGDTALIGSPGAALTTGFATGAAYVFTRSGDTWTQSAKLSADDGVAQDDFGFGVAISGTTAIMTSVNATIGSNTAQGAAYVFEGSGADWQQVTELTADDGAADDSLGYAVAFDGTTALIGAPFAAVNGNLFQGAVYAFSAPGGTWSQQQKLVATEGLPFDAFGISVSMSNQQAVVTAPFYNGSQGDAFLFSSDGTSWTEQHQFIASDGIPGNAYGYDGAISNGTILIGAVFNTVGSNEKQGAAYFYSSDEIFANGFE